MRTCIGFALAAIFCYFFVDLPFVKVIAPYKTTFYLPLKSISLLIFPPFYLAIFSIAFLWIRLLNKSNRLSLFFFELTAIQVFSIACVRILKVVIGRVRPENFLSNEWMGFKFFSLSHHFHSIPSGHTMTAFSIATSIALFFPRFRILSLVLAFLLSSSRAFLLDHFPSDLFATGSLGMIIAQMIHIMLQKVTDTNPGRYYDRNSSATRNP